MPGFTRDQLEITLEENQLVIAGARPTTRRAIISPSRIGRARSFQRTFLAGGNNMEVMGAESQQWSAFDRPCPARTGTDRKAHRHRDRQRSTDRALINSPHNVVKTRMSGRNAPLMKEGAQ